MNRWFSFVLALGILTACKPPQSQSAPYGNNFDSANPLEGWFFYDPYNPDQNPSPSVQTLWAVDGQPSDMPGGSTYSGTNSLNYNNNVNYDTGKKAGAAISPFLDISDMGAPVCAFRCNYQTETSGTDKDQRWVKIGYVRDDGTIVYLLETQLSTSPGSTQAGACASAGTWHQHVIALDPAWGQIHVALLFDSVDANSNAFKGWFVDNFQVVERANVDQSPQNGNGGGGTVVTRKLYETKFDTADGWTFQNGTATGANGGVTGWAVDGTPGAPAGFAYKSSPYSLNYNNGVAYDTGGNANSGKAISPSISLTGASNTKLRFQCNYETETRSTTVDRRNLRIVSSGTARREGLLAEYGGLPEFGACSPMGSWHTHEIVLDPSWGSIQIEYGFDTVNGTNNYFKGWFIDDFEVIGDGAGNVAGSTESGGGGGSGSSKKKGCSASSTSETVSGALLAVFGLFAFAAVLRFGWFGRNRRFSMNRAAGMVAVGLILAGVVACGGSEVNAPEVQAPYSNYFDGADALTNWLFYDPQNPEALPDRNVRTLWAVDGLPSNVPGGAVASGSGSLNYNNGTDYNEGDKEGIAISPFLHIEEMKAPVLAFRCNYQTETSDNTGDTRYVMVGYLDGDGKPVYHLQAQLSSTGATLAGNCAAPGTWHIHVIPLNRDWEDVHVVFKFDSNGVNNNFGGWFVDNFQVVESGNVDYSGGINNGGNNGGNTPRPVAVYRTGFDSPEAIDGWTPAVEAGKVGWAYDGSPSSVGGGAFRSSPNSLNYNNGSNYGGAATNSGYVLSPRVNVTGLSNVRLNFMCNYETETLATGRDDRTVQIVLADNPDYAVFSEALATNGASDRVGACRGMREWHQHSIGIDPAWGSVRVKYIFDTKDGTNNNFGGWFVDDFEVIGDSTGIVYASTEGRGSGSGKKSGCSGDGGTGPEAAFVALLALLVAARLGSKR